MTLIQFSDMVMNTDIIQFLHINLKLVKNFSGSKSWFCKNRRGLIFNRFLQKEQCLLPLRNFANKVSYSLRTTFVHLAWQYLPVHPHWTFCLYPQPIQLSCICLQGRRPHSPWLDYTIIDTLTTEKVGKFEVSLHLDNSIILYIAQDACIYDITHSLHTFQLI